MSPSISYWSLFAFTKRQFLPHCQETHADSTQAVLITGIKQFINLEHLRVSIWQLIELFAAIPLILVDTTRCPDKKWKTGKTKL
jgi:hypothetical protein